MAKGDIFRQHIVDWLEKWLGSFFNNFCKLWGQDLVGSLTHRLNMPRRDFMRRNSSRIELALLIGEQVLKVVALCHRPIPDKVIPTLTGPNAAICARDRIAQHLLAQRQAKAKMWK